MLQISRSLRRAVFNKSCVLCHEDSALFYGCVAAKSIIGFTVATADRQSGGRPGVQSTLTRRVYRLIQLLAARGCVQPV